MESYLDLKFINEGVNKLYAKLQGWGEGVIGMLPNFLLAVLILIVFWGLSRWIRRGVSKVFSKSRMNESLDQLLATICQVIVICIGLVLALAILELQKTVFSLLAGVGVIGLALGFAFQDLAANFISGVMLALRAPVDVGDVVEINGIQGNVIEVRLRDTIVRNFDGQDIFIPNKHFTSNELTNYSSFGKRKVRIVSGIGYENNIVEGVKVFKKALAGVDGILSDPEPQVYVDELAGSSVNLIGHAWIKYPGENYLQVKSDAITSVKNSLQEEGFNIPFPIRTLDISDEVINALSGRNEKETVADSVNENSDGGQKEGALQ